MNFLPYVFFALVGSAVFLQVCRFLIAVYNAVAAEKQPHDEISSTGTAMPKQYHHLGNAPMSYTLKS
jgi:hypothetical protein